MEKNPFVIKSYESKELFCDREKELQLMVRNCTNGADMTLISQRRMGKTGLILRLFDELRELEPDLKTIYVDIYASRSLADFIKLLAEASLRAFPKKDSMGEKILGFLKSLRPQFSFDPITGDPQLQINYQTEQEKEYTLRGLLDFLNNQGETYIAIDEFQQIREWRPCCERTCSKCVTCTLSSAEANDISWQISSPIRENHSIPARRLSRLVKYQKRAMLHLSGNYLKKEVAR